MNNIVINSENLINFTGRIIEGSEKRVDASYKSFTLYSPVDDYIILDDFQTVTLCGNEIYVLLENLDAWDLVIKQEKLFFVKQYFDYINATLEELVIENKTTLLLPEEITFLDKKGVDVFSKEIERNHLNSFLNVPNNIQYVILYGSNLDDTNKIYKLASNNGE